MALYEYRCTGCGREQEMILPMAEASAPQSCPGCGADLERKFSLPRPAVIRVTNRQKLLRGLNNERGGYRFPGAKQHGNRYANAIWGGLQQENPARGRGF